MYRMAANKITIIGLILISSVIYVCAQTNPPADPTPTPYLGRRETALETIRRQDRAQARLEQQTYSNLYGQGNFGNSSRRNAKWRQAMVTLYRKPGKKETKALAPGEHHLQKYAELLASKKTGLFKLLRDQGCDDRAKILDAAPICQKLGFPGAGTSYSFRLDNYRIRRLADITLIKSSLIARGVYSGAIFVELGDVPIENVGLNTPGLSYLAEYRPVKTAKGAMDAAKRFAKGVKKDGFIYGRGVYVSKGNTFAMRSIAYRGKYVRSEAGVLYNELDFDKRRDVIVVFRILDVEGDGSVTIVWKGLRDSKSPKLKVSPKTD